MNCLTQPAIRLRRSSTPSKSKMGQIQVISSTFESQFVSMKEILVVYYY